MEEAALEIEVGRVLYLSENLYVESGDYRHELILYRLAAVRRRPARHAQRSAHARMAPARRAARPAAAGRTMARELAFDFADGFRRPISHLVTDGRPA